MKIEIALPESQDEQRVLFGPHDAHLRLLRGELGVAVHARGGRIQLEGEEEAVARAANVVERLVDAVGRGQTYLADELAVVLELGAGEERRIAEGVVCTERRKITATSPGQRAYLEKIRLLPLVFGLGPAGTGKTYLAVACAVEALRRGTVKKIVLTRPAVEAGERLGFLPGDLRDKVDPYLRPIHDALEDMISRRQLAHYAEIGLIEIAPLAFMRGRTLSRSFVILDEAQNTTPGQMKMMLTRLGPGSRCVVTGDLTQIDLPEGGVSGLADAVGVLGRLQGAAVVRLGAADVVRHELVRGIIEAYEGRGGRGA